MALTLVREPVRRDGWVYEETVDGWRIISHKDRNRVRLVSPRPRRFADLAASVRSLMCEEREPYSRGAGALQ